MVYSINGVVLIDCLEKITSEFTPYKTNSYRVKV